MLGADFAKIIKSKIFNPHLSETKQLIQDNDPVQNSGIAKRAFQANQIELVAIPSKSPDINVIENLFNITKAQLQKQALDKNITRESRTQYTLRIQQLLESFSIDVVNKLVDSLPNRMNLLIKTNGTRLRY